VRDILIDMARTWMRLALEAEQWTQMNRPSTRLRKMHHGSHSAPRLFRLALHA
jgi:hypothetical protein